MSRRQVEFAGTQGIAVYKLSAGDLTDAPETIVDCLCAELSKAGAAILTTPTSELQLDPNIIPALLAAIVRAVLDRCNVCVLVLSGGDTAQAVASAIGATRIRLMGAIEPGIAFGRWQDGLAQHQAVVTKAGGFGRVRSLHEIIELCPSDPPVAQ